MPVITTTTRVIVANPPALLVIPTAIAVVTDFGKSEIAKKYFIPKNLATIAVKTVLITEAKMMLMLILLM